MKLNARPVSAVTAATLAVLLLAPPARADIRDGAKFFSADALRQGDQLIREIRQRHQKDVVIETLASVPNAPAPAAARQDFYEQEVARRGRDAGITGVYVLASAEPRYLYAGVDPQTQKDLFTLEDRAKLRNVMIEPFKTNNYDAGLLAGLRMIDQTMSARASGGRGGAAAVGAAPPVPAGQQPGAAPSGGAGGGSGAPGGPVVQRRGFSLGGLLCLGIAAIAVFVILRGFMRRRAMTQQGFPMGGRPGYDPRTGQPMGGYDPRYGPQGGMGGMGGGGGMGRGLLGGLLGGVAGGYLYDKMSGGHGDANAAPPPADPGAAGYGSGPADTSGGGSFDAGGGDFSGGGDFGGGDTGGGGDF